MLSLVHVPEWRAAVLPGAIALSDQQGAELTYAGLAGALLRLAAPGDVAPANTARANGAAEPGFDAGALVGWARERLAGFKCPTGVTIAPELPRNATGKVLRAKLRAPFWAGRDRQAS